MSASQRRKGHDFERLVVSNLVEWLGDEPFEELGPIRRNLSQTRDGDTRGGDVLGLPAHIECKKHKRLNLTGWMSQARENCGEKPPVVAFTLPQSARPRFLVEMSLPEFVEWVSR